MDISLLLKTVGVGMIVAVANQILQKTGRDEQAMLVTIVGIIVVLIMLMGQLEELFSIVRSVFEL
jgi:stage III sporulation protein AC